MQPRIKIETLFPVALLLPTIILIEGFASIAVEILTIRQLLPVAGSSVVVTSIIIGIFLLFLAIGYDIGGRITHDLYPLLRRNFFIAATWVGIGLSYLFINHFFNFIHQHISSHTVIALIIYLLLVLSPAIFLLGQTLPITMNIVRQNKLAGAIAGKALGLSTIGSFLGATVTTLILMHYAGVAMTVFVIFLLLLGLALLLSQSQQAFIWQALAAFIATCIVYICNISTEKHMFVLANNHANYQIVTQNTDPENPTKFLVINDSYSSRTKEGKDPFPYIEALHKIISYDLMLRQADILVLGAGGFTLSQADLSDNHYTYVDIDAQIKQVVEPQFLEKIKGDLIADDARHFIANTQKKYDVIISDAYSNLTAIPAHLLTIQFMQGIKKRLKEDGFALFNVIAKPFFSDTYSRRIDNTIRSVFGSCTVTPVHYHTGITNLIYACSNEADTKDNTVYTDNLNNSTMDSYTW